MNGWCEAGDWFYQDYAGTREQSVKEATLRVRLETGGGVGGSCDGPARHHTALHCIANAKIKYFYEISFYASWSVVTMQSGSGAGVECTSEHSHSWLSVQLYSALPAGQVCRRLTQSHWLIQARRGSGTFSQSTKTWKMFQLRQCDPWFSSFYQELALSWVSHWLQKLQWSSFFVFSDLISHKSTNMTEKDELVQRAKLAEQAERLVNFFDLINW